MTIDLGEPGLDNPATTVELPAGILDAFARYAEATLVQRRRGCWLLRVSPEHYVVFGPEIASLACEDTTANEVSLWIAASRRAWLATFETVGDTLVTHLRAH